MYAFELTRRPPSRLPAPAIAGAVYVAAWIVGLTVWTSSPGPGATARQVVHDFGAHVVLGAAQFVLVEGLAAIALAYVLIALARRSAEEGAGRAAVLLATIGLAACAISVSQCVLGVVLATALASRAHLGGAGAVFNVINRLDGAKMLLLAATIAAAAPARKALRPPRWMAGLDVSAVLALVLSGIGYVTHSGGLSDGAAVSLPLLLTWVATSAVLMARAA
jgi:hypothetical protein